MQPNNKYKNILYNQLAEDIEPDCEDFYLCEIEEKANILEKLKQWLEEEITLIQKEMNKSSKGLWKYHLDKGKREAFKNVLDKIKKLEEKNRNETR